jgi:hypothetical protein
VASGRALTRTLGAFGKLPAKSAAVREVEAKGGLISFLRRILWLGKGSRGAVDQFSSRERHALEHLSLPVAAAQTFYQVSGSATVIKNAAHLDRILNDVAHAITNVVPIHVPDGQATRQVSAIELLESSFMRGATVLKLKDGTELKKLTIRRRDMRAAVALLIAVHARFDGSEN